MKEQRSRLVRANSTVLVRMSDSWDPSLFPTSAHVIVKGVLTSCTTFCLLGLWSTNSEVDVN